jgi:hypothetical protein
VTDVPRCRRCRRPLRTDASDRGGLGLGCWRLIRRRRRRGRSTTALLRGFPPIDAYRTAGQIPGQTEIPIDNRTGP